MKTVFADTSYFIALLSADDANHAWAMAASAKQMQLVTTHWVLAELAAYLSSPPNRVLFGRVMAAMQNSPLVEVIPATDTWFHTGVDLYLQRDDKQWSLVDCISFRVMQDRGLHEALSSDHHFEQAGFACLVR